MRSALVEFAVDASMWQELGVTTWLSNYQPAKQEDFEPTVPPTPINSPLIKQPVLLLADFENDPETGQISSSSLSSHGVTKLWQDVLHVHFSRASPIVFGLADLKTDEQCYELVDQIIEWDIEALFIFGHHELMTEVLSEGVELVRLPSIEELLDTPVAKQRCYATLAALNFLN